MYQQQLAANNLIRTQLKLEGKYVKLTLQQQWELQLLQVRPAHCFNRHQNESVS
jgi:hypothetical protein